VRPVRIASSLVASMAAHARATYPEECCGFLIARLDPVDPAAPRAVVAVEPAPNDFGGERRRRFLVRPEELRAAERRLEGTDRAVAGFYHSHPDHPGRPSQFDQAHAWPWYTYVVLSVDSTAVRESRAFELDADALEFREVPLTVDPEPAGSEGSGGVSKTLRAARGE
jgi:proteasome lid subunit RPN8/RPN11